MSRTAAVLAGGLGTRVAGLTSGAIPKALLPVAGRPFIDLKLDQLSSLGIDRAVLLLGVHADQIVDYVGDGSRWGLEITIARDADVLAGTGGAVQGAIGLLPPRFWVTYADTLVEADLAEIEGQTEANGWGGAMTVLANRDRWQCSNVSVRGNKVVAYEKRPLPGTHLYLDYGLLLLPSYPFRRVADANFDLSVVLEDLISDGALGAVEVRQPFHDIGTPQAFRETEEWAVESIRAQVTR
jgi:NDP-sugar pyrophosphorylase family protein